MKIAVVGAGIIGLSSAEAILEYLGTSDIELTVYSNEFTPGTTGDISAGFIFPYYFGENNMDDMMRWTRETIEHLIEVRNKGDVASTGISPISGYDLWKRTPPTLDLKQMFNGVRKSGTEELRQVFGDRYAGGYFFNTWTCNCNIYLPYLMEKLKKDGVKFMKKKIHSFGVLADRGYDVVLNCTGFGAKSLTHDELLHPIKGQVLEVEAPWIKNFYAESDGDVYFLPRIGSLIVGGTHTEDSSLDVDEVASGKIWKDACEVMPSLKHARIIKANAGIRPGRPQIRLEAELMQSDYGKNYMLLHNYGHGGSGVTIHWGCAKEVVSILRKFIESRISKL